MPTAAAIIVCAGHSTRMRGGMSKILLPLGGTPVIVHTLTAFARAGTISEIVLVTRAQDKESIREIAQGLGIQKPVCVVEGGETRQHSVQNGVDVVTTQAKFLVIHDGARPMITPQMIDAVVCAAYRYQAVTMAVRVKDTIKVAGENRMVLSTPDRSALWSIQTPQVFESTLYRRAMTQAVAEQKEYTDDCQLVEQAGHAVYLFEGSYRNIKITTPEDIVIAERFLPERDEKGENQTKMRIGHGYDVHKLVEGRKLILGGVDIPYEKGLLGHSDADVLAHAISDALLGGATLGDIGTLFPDTDAQYKNADSLMLLSKVCEAIREKGFDIGNIDATILAQKPKLAPYIEEMRTRVAEVCGLSTDDINIKATTEEYLGFTGRGEGIAAHAVCLLRQS